MPTIRRKNPDEDPTYQSLKIWGSLKETTDAGVPIVYGGDHYGRDPEDGPKQGIGIWKRHSPNHRSWDGLLEMPLKLIVTRWVIRGIDFGLRLPYMGMPPREPPEELMFQAVHWDSTATDWFKYINVIPATVFNEFVKIDPQDATMELRGSMREYNYSTAEPEVMRTKSHLFKGIPEHKRTMDNLYYVQLLRNELPSYHFWHEPGPIGPSGEFRDNIFELGPNACYKIKSKVGIRNINPNILPSAPAWAPSVGSSLVQRQASNRSQPYPTVKPNVRPRKTARPLAARITRRQTSAGGEAYQPEPGEGDEPQEVRLNRRKRKSSGGKKAYKPLPEDAEEE